jgi:bifunctional non-homologous end joining protein LigD
VDVTHADKVLFPAAGRGGATKLDLARHYLAVAPAMVRHMRGRPVAMQAFPGGVERSGFFLKSVPDHFPDWIHRVTVDKRGGTVTHVVVDNAATLVYLAGQNVITPHVWPARGDRPREPDRLIFDFDPSGTRFADVRAAARATGDRLRDLGLAPYAMVSGSRGIHVVVPLRRGPRFELVQAFARGVADELVAADPRHLTLDWRKADRGTRIYVDVKRNAYAQHAVAPYAVRPRPNASVAMPLHWDELADARLRPDRFTIRTAADRLRAEGDPWQGMARAARSLPGPDPAPA